MLALTERVVGHLKAAGLREVYPAFDAVPFSRKSQTLFTVVTPETIQLDFPFPDSRGDVRPFTARFRASVLIPMGAPVQWAEDFFYQKLLPCLEQMGSVLCEIHAPQTDIALGRVAFAASFRLRGMYVDDGKGGAL